MSEPTIAATTCVLCGREGDHDAMVCAWNDEPAHRACRDAVAGNDSERHMERRRWLATTCGAVHADEEGFYLSWRDDSKPWARRRSATDSFSSANEAIDAAIDASRAAEPEGG